MDVEASIIENIKPAPPLYRRTYNIYERIHTRTHGLLQYSMLSLKIEQPAHAHISSFSRELGANQKAWQNYMYIH